MAILPSDPYHSEPRGPRLSYGEALGHEPAAAESDPPTPPPLHRLVEALLFVGGPPLTAAQAAIVVRGLTPPLLQQAVDTLNRDYRNQGRPYRIRADEHGFTFALLPGFRRVQDRLHGSNRETRLSPAVLDVLSLVAYRQPATKAEVDSLRGGDTAAALRQLVRVGLVAVQRGQAREREVSYTTTSRFLTLFGLANLDDLPRTQDPERM